MCRICTKAGIPGYKTNHLLRVSAVTRLFQKDVDEQLIISVTGYCSIDRVRAYKRVSDNQKQQLSEYLQAFGWAWGQGYLTRAVRDLMRAA